MLALRTSRRQVGICINIVFPKLIIDDQVTSSFGCIAAGKLTVQESVLCRGSVKTKLVCSGDKSKARFYAHIRTTTQSAETPAFGKTRVLTDLTSVFPIKIPFQILILFKGIKNALLIIFTY